MEKNTNEGIKIADVAGRVVRLLGPLSPENQQKVIQASLTLLGISLAVGGTTAAALEHKGTPGSVGKSHPKLPKAAQWLKQNDLTTDRIENVFDISSDGVPVIASDAPGGNRKEKVHNAYVLLGLSRLLATGEATFDDNSARELCKELGCYDKTNHSAYMGDKGNVLTGSKSSGWKLTAPGLKRGAELVKQLTDENR